MNYGQRPIGLINIITVAVAMGRLPAAQAAVLSDWQFNPLPEMTPVGKHWVLGHLIVSQQPAQETPSPEISPQTLPPATFPTQKRPFVSVPPPQSDKQQVIEFGQPLPKKPGGVTAIPQNSLPSPPQGVNPLALPIETSKIGTAPFVVVPGLDGQPPQASSTARQSSPQSANIILPIGTLLILHYTGNGLKLPTRLPEPEVLFLQEDVRDRTGQVLATAGTPVLGRFETDARGSRFVTQSLVLKNRSLPLSAESDSLGNSRIGTFSQEFMIYPGQVLLVRLTENLVMNQ